MEKQICLPELVEQKAVQTLSNKNSPNIWPWEQLMWWIMMNPYKSHQRKTRSRSAGRLHLFESLGSRYISCTVSPAFRAPPGQEAGRGFERASRLFAECGTRELGHAFRIGEFGGISLAQLLSAFGFHVNFNGWSLMKQPTNFVGKNVIRSMSNTDGRQTTS